MSSRAKGRSRPRPRSSGKLSPGSIAARLVTGEKVGPLRDNNYKAVLGKEGKKVAQVSDRASDAILEGLPSEVEARAGKLLKESGKGGTGRYVVPEAELDKARELIAAAHVARAKAIKEVTKRAPSASTNKGTKAAARATASADGTMSLP